MSTTPKPLQKHCTQCGHEYALRYFSEGESVCRHCANNIPPPTTNLAPALSSRGLADAANHLSKELAKNAKTDAQPHAPAIWDGFIGEVLRSASEAGINGTTGEVMGQLMGKEFFKAFHPTMTDEEKKKLGYIPSIRTRWAALVQKCAADRDDRVGKTDLSGVPEEDLMQGMLAAASRLVGENERFRREVIYREMQLNPAFRAEVESMLRHSGGVVGSAVIQADEPDYSDPSEV